MTLIELNCSTHHSKSKQDYDKFTFMENNRNIKTYDLLLDIYINSMAIYDNKNVNRIRKKSTEKT